MARAYPLFDVPDLLLEVGRENWDSKQAKEYREWLLSVLEQRVRALQDYLKVPREGKPANQLLAAGERAASLLGESAFSEDSVFEHPLTGEKSLTKTLTSQGFALGADMGLLVGRFLWDALPGKLKWETVRRPRNDGSYNSTVITGFESGLRFDPVRWGLGIATSVAKGNRGFDAWKLGYEVWLEDKKFKFSDKASP